MRVLITLTNLKLCMPLRQYLVVNRQYNSHKFLLKGNAKQPHVSELFELIGFEWVD